MHLSVFSLSLFYVPAYYLGLNWSHCVLGRVLNGRFNQKSSESVRHVG
jgi:hypothetical protein